MGKVDKWLHRVCQSLEMHFQHRFPSQCLPRVAVNQHCSECCTCANEISRSVFFCILVLGLMGSPLISHSLVTPEWVLRELCDIQYLWQRPARRHESPTLLLGRFPWNHFQIFGALLICHQLSDFINNSACFKFSFSVPRQMARVA